MDISRHKNGEFEPKIIPKYRTDVSGIKELEALKENGKRESA
ncbi:MAG: hypothetical protein WCD89_18300 [Anaerocolumna sp.]